MAFLIKSQRNRPDGLDMLRFWRHLVRADATLPETTTETLFTVANGNCLVHLMYGVIGTVVQAQSCNLSVNNTPTTGASLVIATTVDINGSNADTVMLVEGDGTALVETDNVLPLFAVGTPVPWFVKPGTITHTTSATNTGSVAWHLYYEPLDEVAVITVG